MSRPIRVVVVDDHRVVREGLRAMLQGVSEIEIVGEAEDLDGALASIRATQPDVVLLDVRLERSSGLDACRTIVDRHPGVSVVFLTVYEDEQYVFEALRAGARGYMLKKATPEDIVRVLQAVQAGEVVIDPALGGQIALRAAAVKAGSDWPGAHLGLTPREGEVLTHLVRGLDNKAIGHALYITEDTVKSHVKGILRKLGARDRQARVRSGRHHGRQRSPAGGLRTGRPEPGPVLPSALDVLARDVPRRFRGDPRVAHPRAGRDLR